jgi:PAS domain-containing protein
MRAEEALRAPEEKYRTLFDSIDEGFCTIEVLFDEHGEAADYRFLESNPAFERQTGLENAVGKTVRELAPEHEDFWFDVYGRIARTGEAIRFEHEAAALGRFYDVYAFRIGEPGEDRVPDGVETNLSATGDETAVPPARPRADVPGDEGGGAQRRGALRVRTGSGERGRGGWRARRGSRPEVHEGADGDAGRAVSDLLEFRTGHRGGDPGPTGRLTVPKL